MIYGNVDTETVQLNEYTVWSGSPNRNDNILCLDSLAEIRQLIFDGKQKEAEALPIKPSFQKHRRDKCLSLLAIFGWYLINMKTIVIIIAN